MIRFIFTPIKVENLSMSLPRLFFVILLCSAMLGSAQFCKGQVNKDSSKTQPVNPVTNEKAAPRHDTLQSGANSPTSSDSLAYAQRPHRFQPNPKKAGLYSAIVPGLGQLYNRQYWKVPLVYAGLTVAGYYFVQNLNDYQAYRLAYIGRINNPYPTDKYVNIYTTSQLQQLQNDYNKFLDLTVLFTGLGYALQVMDAVTSAHLKNFDISRDISMHLRPVITPNGPGLGIVMNYK